MNAYTALQFCRRQGGIFINRTTKPLSFTYRLANTGIPGLSYASNEHHTCQENMKAQIN